MNFIIAILCFITIVTSTLNNLQTLRNSVDKSKTIQMSYEDFLQTYKPQQKNLQSYQLRRKNFIENLKIINQHNLNTDSFVMGLNKFADISPQQFKSIYLQTTGVEYLGIVSIKPNLITNSSNIQKFNDTRYQIPPVRIDWRKYGGFVYQSKNCVTDFIIASIQTIQITLSIKNKKEVLPLSVQQALSCWEDRQCAECKGGRISDVYDYVVANGINSQQKYPLNIDTLYNCQKTKCNKSLVQMKDKVRIKSYKRIINSNCAEIIQILKFQVLTTLIAVDGLQFYKDKILKVDNSLKKKSNYAVVLVGFDGLNQQQPYFIIKNSWGASWGINGYGYVSRNAGVCDFAITPIFN